MNGSLKIWLKLQAGNLTQKFFKKLLNLKCGFP